MTSPAHLYRAYLLARKGKRRKPAVLRFTLNLERELSQLHHELREQRYQPGRYHLFTLYERKPRQIAAAPFRDRVVHHAVMSLIEPAIDGTFIDHSYACRKGKGTHVGVAQYQRWAQIYPFVLQMDIQRYFPSIPRECLKEKLRRYIKDSKLLWLLDLIIDNSPEDARSPVGCGIPIGNLTSQFFANLYLNEFDHAVKQQLKAPAYGRYVDDMVILNNDKAWLHDAQRWCAGQLQQEGLTLHPNKCHIVPVRCGIDYLGYRVLPNYRLLRNDNGHRFARKLRRMAQAYADHRLDFADINPSVQSWCGHARHASTQGLLTELFAGMVLRRGGRPDRQPR
ncbi:RNA-dependent DNA polymerase [Ectothiorhodospiraceae bacterium BW-2]|nr:RNA-dependent DNA polymerase [Ectothiorhodospiraceae bacterium BW-2]